MTYIKTARPAFIQTNRLYPAQYYTRPALPAVSIVGNIGHTQRNLLNQYSYTIQQMASSPFSVNNEGYMERVRKEYGIQDRGLYDLYGNIGAFIGVGLAGAFTLGYIKGPKSIVKGDIIGKFNPKITATRQARNVAMAPKKDPNKYNYNTALVKNKPLVIKYNKEVDLLNESRKKFETLNTALQQDTLIKTNADNALNAAQDSYKNSKFKYTSIKGTSQASKDKVKALAEIAELQKKADDAQEVVRLAASKADEAADAFKITQESAETVYKTLTKADKVFDSVELGTKAAAKTGGFVPIVGIGMDALSLSLSAAAFYDSIESGDVNGMWLNGVATFLDAVALVADFFPGVGDLISIGASVASAGVTGAYVGKTIGHSLSPEGIQAQINFFKNLHQSVIARPISTAASLLTMFGVQAVAHAGAKNNSKWAKFWTSTSIGNLGRQAVTMGAMQFVNKQSSWVEEQLKITPTNPNEVNFTNGIGIWGDINDNLFGATLRKSQMASLLDKESGVSFSELFEKSWGINKDGDEMFYSIMFSDVRQAAKIDLKVPLLNSLIDIVGETLVDPQNYVEAYQTSIQTKAKDLSIDLYESNFKKAEIVVRLKQAALLEKNPTDVIKFDPKIEMFEYLVGPEGVFRGEGKNRVRLLRQLVDAYTEKGEVGLRRTLTELLIIKNKGTIGTKYETLKDTDKINIALVSELFDDVFVKGNYTPLKYSNANEIQLYKERLKTLDQVMKDVKENLTLNSDQEAIKVEASKIMQRLENYYGKDASITLIDKFIEDLGAEVPNNHLRALYLTSQDIKFHTDLAGESSNLATWMFMPVQKIMSFNTIRKAFKTAANFGRFVFRVKGTSAKTIMQVAEVFQEIQKNFTRDHIQPLIDALPKDVTPLDDILKTNVEADKDIVDEGIKELSKAVDKVTKEKEDIQQKERVYKEALKLEEKLYEEHEQLVYVPSTTTYGGTDDYVYIKDEKTARAILKEAIAFEEKEIFSKGMTINQYMLQNKKNINAKKYEAQKIAAADYFQHVMYKTIFAASKEQQGYLLNIISSMNVDIYNENVNVLKAHGYFRRYFNAHVERPAKEVQTENLERHKKYHGELEETLKTKETDLKNTEETLEKINKEIKEKETDLKKVYKEKNTERSVFLELTIKELSSSKDILFKQRQALVDVITKLRETVNHEIAIIKSLEELVTKLNNYDMAKKVVESRGEVWDDKKHFDPETMSALGPIRESIFNKLSFDEETKMLNEMQRILKKNGVVYKYTVPGKEAVIVEFGQALQDLPIGTKLELEYTVDLTSAIYGVIADVLNINETNINFTGIVKELKDDAGNPLDFNKWLKMGSELQTKYVIQVLRDMNLTKEQQALLDGATVRTITAALSKVVLSKGVIRKHITDLSEGVLNRVVMSNLIKSNSQFRNRYDSVFKQIDKAQERIDELRKTIESTDVEERKLLMTVIDQHVRAFNKHFKYMYAYKYIRDNVIKRVSKDASKDLFGSFEELRGSVIPDYKPIKDLVKDPLKNLHTLEDMLVDHIESELFQQVIKISGPSIEHAKLVASSGVSDTADEAYIKSKDDAIMERELSKAEEKEVKDAVEKAYNDIVGDVSKYNMTGVKIVTNLDNESKVKKQPFSKDIKDDKKLDQVQTEIFGGVPYVRDYTTTRVELTPLLILKNPKSKAVVNYNKFIKDSNRTSPGHRRSLRLFAEYLYHTIKESKGTLSIDEDNIRKFPALRAGIKFDTEEGKKEYFIRRIVATYEDENLNKPVALIYNNKKQAQGSTFALKAIVNRTLNNYVHKNSSDKLFEEYDKDTEGYLTKDAVKKLALDLAKAKETDKELYDLRNLIWKEAVGIFERVKVSQNKYFDRVLKRLDTVHEYERKDSKALSESFNTVSYDVVNKLIYNKKEMLKLLEAIMKYDGITDTGLLTLDIIKLVDRDLVEDYENKEPFLINDYKDVVITDGKVFLQKNDNTTTSLFNVIYKQRVSIKYLRALLNKLEITGEKTAAVELAYTELINEYKDILYYTPIDLSKDVFMTSGGTEEEWSFIENNPDINSLYQMLVTDMNLKYSERKITSALTKEEKIEQSKQTVETMRLLLNPTIIKLYNASFDTSGSYHKMLKDSGLLEANMSGEQAQKILFGYLVLKSTSLGKTPEENKRIKHLFLNNVLFYNASIGKAAYTDKKVEGYKKELKSLEGLTDEANSNKRIVLENKIKKAEEVNKKLAYDFLETPEGRTEYFIKNPKRLVDFFGFYRDTDADDNAFVMALNKEGKYILIENDISNYNIISKGVPPINLAVFDIVNNVAKKSIQDTITSRINKPAEESMWNLINPKDIKEIIVGENGNVFIITKDSVVKDKKGKEYINVNTELHDSIKEKRSGLIFDLNKDRESDLVVGIYTMSQRQYEEIRGVAKDKLDTEVVYEAIETKEPGRYYGETEQLVTTTSVKSLTEAYMLDMARLSGIEKKLKKADGSTYKDYEEVLDNLIKYTEIYLNRVLLSEAYQTHTPFSASQSLQDLKNISASLKAYYRFIEALKLAGIDINNSDLELLTKHFFRNEFITNNEAGKPYDLDKLQKDVKENIWDIYIRRGEIEKIKLALQSLQVDYANSDIIIKGDHTLPEKFLDGVKTLRSTSMKLLYNLKNYNKRLQQDVFNIVNKQYKSDFLYGKQVEEMRDRMQLNNILLESAGIDVVNKEGYLRNPLSNEDAFKESVAELKKDFSLNEIMYMTTGKDLYNEHDRATTAHNSNIVKRKNNRLNFSIFWNLVKAFNGGVTAKNRLIDYENTELRKLSEQLYNIIKRYQEDPSTISATRVDQINRFFVQPKTKINKISSVDQVYNLILNGYIASYISNIKSHIQPDKIELDILMMWDSTIPGRAQKRLEAYQKVIADKTRYKLNTGYRSQAPDLLEPTAPGITVEKWKASFFTALLGKETPKVQETSKEIVDYLEKYLFNGSEESYNGEVRKLEKILADNKKTKSLPPTLAEYYKEIINSDDRLAIEFIINTVVFKRETTFNPEQEKVIDTFIKRDKQIAGQVVKDAWEILKKNSSRKEKPTYTSGEVWKYFNLPLLNNSKEFIDYFLYEYLGTKKASFKVDAYLELFGITDDKLKYFKKQATLHDVLRYLAPKNQPAEINAQDMYAFTHVVNTAKLLYLAKESKKLGETKLNLFNAWQRHTRMPVRDAQLKIRNANTMGVFDGVYDSNVIKKTMDETNFIFDALNYVKNKNNILEQVMVPLEYKETVINDGTPKFVRQTEAQITTEARKVQRDLFKIFFKEEPDMSESSRQYFELMRELNEAPLHIISEASATDINEVSSDNKIYNTIMHLFTDVAKLVMRNKLKSNEFIRTGEVATIIKTLQESRTTKLYAGVYEDFTNERIAENSEFIDKKSVDAEIEKIVDFFRDNSKLNSFNATDIKAIMGYIFYYRYKETYKINIDAKQFKDYNKLVINAQHNLYMRKLGRISYRLRTAEDDNEVAQIIFGKSIAELESSKSADDKEAVASIKLVRDLRILIQSGLTLDPKYLHDTYVEAIRTEKPLYNEDNAHVRKFSHANDMLVQGQKELISLEDIFKNNLKSISLSASELDTVKNLRDSLETERIFKEEQIKTVTELLNAAKENKTKETEELYYRLITNHPELLLEYIKEQEDYINKRKTEFQKKKDALALKYSEDLRYKVGERLATEKKLETLKNSFRFKVYNYTRSMTPEKAQIYIWDNYKDALEKAGITPGKLTITWLNNTKKELTTLDNLIKEYQKNPIELRNNKGELIYSKKKVVAYKKEFKELSLEEARLESLFERIIVEPEDILEDKELVKRIVTTFTNKLFIKKQDLSKAEFSKLLEKGTVEQLTVEQRTSLLKKFEEDLERVEKSIAKYLNRYNEEQYVYRYYPKDLKNLARYRVTKERLDTLEVKKNLIKTSIKSIKESKTVTLKDIIQQSVQSFADKNGLDFEYSLEDFIDYLSGDALKELHKEVKDTGEELNKFNDQLKYIESKLQMYTDTLDLPTRIEKQANLVKQYEMNKRETETSMNKTLDEHKLSRIHGNSNLGTYKNLKNIKKETDLNKQDRRILNQILKDSKTVYNVKENRYYTEAELRELILKSGELDIHNPVIDDFITRLNYMEQTGKTIDDEFFVLDMETIKHEGQDIPYLITIIHNEKGGKMTVQSIYFNSVAFHRDVLDTDTGKLKDTTTITGFKNDLFNMYAKRIIKHKTAMNSPEEYKLTASEIDELRQKAEAEAERVIDTVNTQKNNQEFVRAYLSIFEYANNNKIDIVTHAGERFDIPNYTSFIRRFANTLLTNMYYSNIYTKNPESILERHGVSSLSKLDDIDDNDMKDRIIGELNQELKSLFNRLEKRATTGVYDELTESELKLITKLNEAIFRVNISKHLRRIEESLGIHLNDAVKKTLFDPETGEIVTIKKLVGNWLGSTGNVRTVARQSIVNYYQNNLELHNKKTPNHNYTKELEKKIDSLLEKVEEDYNAIKARNKSIIYNVLDNTSRRAQMVQGVFKPEETSIKYEAQKFLEGYVREIERLTSTKEMLLTLHNDTLNKTIEHLEKDAEDVLKEKAAIEKSIKDLNDDIANTNQNTDDYLDKLVVFAKKIQNRTDRLFYKIRKTVSSTEIYLSAQNKRSTINPVTESVLNYGIAKTLSTLNKTVTEIEVLIKAVQQLSKAANEKDLNTLGLFEAEWFKFENQKELNTLKKQLEDNDERYKKLLEDMKNNVEYKNLDLRVLLNDEFAAIQKQQEVFVKKLVDKYNDYAERYKLDKLTIDLSKKKVDMEEFNKFKLTVEEQINNLILSSGKNKQKYFETTPEMETILNMVVADGSIERNLRTLKVNYGNKNNIYDMYRDIFIQGIEQSRRNDQAKISALGAINLKDSKTVAIELLNLKLKGLLDSVKQGDLLQEDIQAHSILNLVSERGITTDQMSKEDFEKAARARMDKMFVDALDDPYTVRRYDTALRYNNKKALMMKEDKVYYKPVINADGSMTYVFNFFDQTTQTTNQITINTHNPQQLRSNFKYVYRYANQPLDRPREIKLSNLNFVETSENYGQVTKSFLNTSKTIDNFYKKYTPEISAANVYKVNGKDGSFESLKRALLFYETKLQKAINNLPSGYKKLSAEEQVKIFEKHFKFILDESANAYELKLKDLEIVDMTARTEKMFIEYIKTARLLAGRSGFRDAAGVYQSLSDRLLSKYNSLVPGKILNLIAPEFSTDFIITYDDKTLDEMNIDLLNASEGSMGTSFAERSPYTTHLPFKHNINSIRVGLSGTQQYKDHTAIGLINTLYLIEDSTLKDIIPKDYDNDVSKYLDKIKPVGGNYDKRVVFLKNKTLSTYDQVKNKKDILIEYTEDVVTRLKELITPHAFIPQVVSAEDKIKYLNDTLHKRGVNLSVLFTNDARAFEDVILFDYDDATALTWNKGYKTWLGLYGFKGGVRLVKGLREQYGASIVASATSVVKRGAYGALVEMFVSNFKEAYYKNSTEPLKEKDTFYELVKMYKDKSSNIHKYIKFEDGFAIVKPNVNYTDFFNDTTLFKGHEGKTEQKKFTDIFDKYLKPTKTGNVSYNYTINNKNTTIKTSVQDGWFGKLHVGLDSEHITEHMANKSEVRNYGGIAVAQVDKTGTVLNGVVLSESVLYPMLAKASNKYLDWSKIFYDESDPQKVMFTNTKVNEYTDMAYKGIEYILSNYAVRVNGVISVSTTVDKMTEANMNSNIINYVREYLSYEYLFIDEKKLDTGLVADIELRKAELNQKIRQEAHERLVGDHGMLKSSLFKKHFGGRQQLLANTDLRRGEAITNKDIWENNLKENPKWVVVEDYPLNDFKKDIIKHVYESTGKTKESSWKLNSKKEYVMSITEKELNEVLITLARHGIINNKDSKGKENNDMFTLTEISEGKYTITINAKPQRKFGWMLTMRSPVQDYNAVSLIKIIGYHDHNALEADKYLYLRTGADNDGDTLGMIAINPDKKQYLEVLDATQESFYDQGYFEGVDRGYIKKTDTGFVTPTRPNINGIDIINSNVGREFVGSYTDEEGNKKKIRSNYTWSELYIQTFEKYNIEKIITEEATNKKFISRYPDLENKFITDEALVRTYLNAYIRRATGGYDTIKDFKIDDYGSLKKMVGYIKKYKILNDLVGRYAFDLSIKDRSIKIEELIELDSNDIYEMFRSLDSNDQEHLNSTYKMFGEDKKKSPSHNLKNFLATKSEQRDRIVKEIITNKVLSKLFQITTSRVQGSKVGINYFGGNRKNQMVAVMLSRFILVNKDNSNKFWNKLGAYDASGTLTPISLTTALFTETYIDKLSKNKFSSMDDAIKEGISSVKDFKNLHHLLKSIYEGIDKLDGKKPTVTHDDVKEFIKDVVEIIYDAYKYSNKAELVFTKLTDALNKSSKYKITDFFKESFINDEDLLPMVKRIKDSGKEKLEDFELEWIKIQFWGANKQEASKFIKNITNKSKINDMITAYKDGYLNETIITRKEFKNMSDKATRIINLAKHEGNDIQIYKYITEYMRNVLDETTKQRKRLTNIDSKRAYLNYAVAMNRNPFEDNSDIEIKDADYLKIQKERKKTKRATLQKSYTDTRSALRNLQAITRDNFDIQLLGRTGVSNVIHDYVEDALYTFLNAFKNINISDSRKLVEVASSETVKKAAEILVRFNIAGYKIRNYVLSYMNNYNYINNVLAQQNKGFIDFDQRDKVIIASPTFMEMLYKVATRFHMEKYNELLQSEAPLVNDILKSTLEVDDEYYTWDDEGNLVERTDITETSTNVAHKNDLQEALAYGAQDHSHLPVFADTKTNGKENKILRAFLNKIKLNTSEKHTNFEETLKELIRDYNILRAVYYNDNQLKKELKELSHIDTPEKTIQKQIKKKVTNITLMEEDLRNLFKMRAKIINNKHLIKKYLHSLGRANQKLNNIKHQEEILDQLVNKKTGTLRNMADIETQIKLIDEKILATQDKIKKTEDNILNYVFNQNFNEMLPLLFAQDGSSIQNLYTYSTPRYLSNKDIEDFHNTILMNMHHRMSPFLNSLEGFKKPDGTIDYEEMYKWYAERYDFARITIIRRPDDGATEGLLRRLHTEIWQQELDNKGKKKSKLMFKSEKDIEDFKDRLKLGADQESLRFGKKEYDGIKLDLDTKRFITPTLKEINIRNAEDLKTLHEGIMQHQGSEFLIGFVMINDIMDSYDQAYLPYKQTGFASTLISKMLVTSKFIQRLSMGFLIRNWLDTWNQLYSEAQKKYGNIGVLFKVPEILKIMRGVSELKSIYQRVSVDRILYLTAFKGHYEELKNILNTRKVITPEDKTRLLDILDINIRVLESYRDAKLDGDEFSSRVVNKQQSTHNIITALKLLREQSNKNINTLFLRQNLVNIERGVRFISSMKFAEYFVLYDKLADVFDATHLYESKNVAYIQHIKDRHQENWNNFKTDLFELSAFMQTHAQRDEYQTKQAKTIDEVLNEMMSPDQRAPKDYLSISKELENELTAETSSFVQAFKKNIKPWSKSGDIKGLYSWMTADTETSGRIVGYFLDKYLHDLTFEQSVQKSLTRFFDYGALAPLEKNLLADIPYLSFPIRSINNWISRITDPRYLRHLSDFLDGMYGQYADEEGQYSDFVKYQMANGWIPIMGGFSLRAGNGAFDVMDFLTDPTTQFEKRRGPFGRMLAAIVDHITSKEKDNETLLSEVIKQSAVTGFATRTINSMTAGSTSMRNKLSQAPVARKMVDTRESQGVVKDLARSSTFVHWYDTDNFSKYTPKKYDYSQGNGRVKYYENMYKDWFNKYGKMRKPKVDPYSLVKDIQWKNYVRYRRLNYMNKY
jgi:hypothetical protein